MGFVGVVGGRHPNKPHAIKLVWDKGFGMKVEIEPKQLVEADTDDRGRFTLGSEYANQTVKMLVLEGSEDE